MTAIEMQRMPGPGEELVKVIQRDPATHRTIWDPILGPPVPLYKMELRRCDDHEATTTTASAAADRRTKATAAARGKATTTTQRTTSATSGAQKQSQKQSTSSSASLNSKPDADGKYQSHDHDEWDPFFGPPVRRGEGTGKGGWSLDILARRGRGGGGQGRQEALVANATTADTPHGGGGGSSASSSAAAAAAARASTLQQQNQQPQPQYLNSNSTTKDIGRRAKQYRVHDTPEAMSAQEMMGSNDVLLGITGSSSSNKKVINSNNKNHSDDRGGKEEEAVAAGGMGSSSGENGRTSILDDIHSRFGASNQNLVSTLSMEAAGGGSALSPVDPLEPAAPALPLKQQQQQHQAAEEDGDEQLLVQVSDERQGEEGLLRRKRRDSERRRGEDKDGVVAEQIKKEIGGNGDGVDDGGIDDMTDADYDGLRQNSDVLAVLNSMQKMMVSKEHREREDPDKDNAADWSQERTTSSYLNTSSEGRKSGGSGGSKNKYIQTPLSTSTTDKQQRNTNDRNSNRKNNNNMSLSRSTNRTIPFNFDESDLDKDDESDDDELDLDIDPVLKRKLDLAVEARAATSTTTSNNNHNKGGAKRMPAVFADSLKKDSDFDDFDDDFAGQQESQKSQQKPKNVVILRSNKSKRTSNMNSSRNFNSSNSGTAALVSPTRARNEPQMSANSSVPVVVVNRPTVKNAPSEPPLADREFSL